MADPNTPTWLQENEAAAAATSSGTTSVPVPPPPAPAASSASAPQASARSSTMTDAEITADDPDLPGVILTMRLANMGAAVFLVVISVLEIISFPDVAGLVLALYASCGGLLICCLETQLKFLRVMIAVNFGFLFTSAWRFLFYVLLGSVAWSFGFWGKICGAYYVAVACFNTYVLCRYPSYRRMREKIAEEEDKRIEARISKEVKRQAARQIMKS